MSSETSIKKRPGTALSIVTEFSGSGLLNPKPAAADPEELMIDQSLSPEKLKILSGSDDLHEVTSLEMDLGTGLSHLQVLYLARCGLTDLEGISALSSLKELYVAFNSISDLSPVSLLEDLELLDLEENEVDDLAQLWYLGRCSNCVRNHKSRASVQSAVRDLIPQLILLDDVPAEEDEPQCFRTSPEDWTVLRESIKDASVSDGPELTDTDTGKDKQHFLKSVSAALHVFKNESLHQKRDLSVPASAPPGDLRISSRSLSSRVGRVLCGNPLQAARAQRQKIKLQNCVSQTRLSTRLSSFIPEHTYEREESSSRDHRDVFTELRRWRIEHNKRLSVIEKEQQPQVMKIHHSDDEDEGRHSHSFCSDDITRDTSSPDSSFQSPSAESPEMLRLSSSSGCSMTPSPPPRAAAAPPAGQRITQIRTRRLRAQNADVSKAKASEETHGTENIMRIIHKPHRPSSSPVASTQWSEATENHQHADNQHKPIIHSEILTPRRPQTARAALQRLPDRKHTPEVMHCGNIPGVIDRRVSCDH
ncbi:Leucine-rich repeat-containing protein 56 [Labeo rohita]|uniref:Leucine-rich repeat-containing protein 56 n=1 Tax=Labeo rohita TaxID=84645 RepID=A0ABQ8LBQ7_LABRO|nr:Leucine-rich repeat-containing protein 56 [Labeo rohita]